VVLRGFLGLEVANTGDAATVAAVLPGSPAAKAGLKVGDRITAFQGKEIRTTADLLKHAAKVGKGDSAEVTVDRGGKAETITIQAGEGL
jgi:serine protease Do